MQLESVCLEDSVVLAFLLPWHSLERSTLRETLTKKSQGQLYYEWFRSRCRVTGKMHQSKQSRPTPEMCEGDAAPPDSSISSGSDKNLGVFHSLAKNKIQTIANVCNSRDRRWLSPFPVGEALCPLTIPDRNLERRTTHSR